LRAEPTPVPQDTNEAKAALLILQTLVLSGRVVTADALFAQPEICREIVDAGGDYLFVVKGNQPELKDAIAGDFLPGFSTRDAA
jgi:predicted transposase YbfD/YdcC